MVKDRLFACKTLSIILICHYVTLTSRESIIPIQIEEKTNTQYSHEIQKIHIESKIK